MDATRGRAGYLVLAALAMSACGRLPSTMVYDGIKLVGESAAIKGGIEGTRYVEIDKAEEVRTVMVKILYATEKSTAVELHKAVLQHYETKSFFAEKHLTWEPEEGVACKIAGIGPPDHIRRFLAVHLCLEKDGSAACAEIDRQLPDFSGCRSTDRTECMKEVCLERLGTWRGDLRELATRGL